MTKFAHTHIHTHTLSDSLSLTHTQNKAYVTTSILLPAHGGQERYPRGITHTCTHTYTFSLCLFRCLSLSPTHTHTLALSLSHTHTHTHTQTRSHTQHTSYVTTSTLLPARRAGAILSWKHGIVRTKVSCKLSVHGISCGRTPSLAYFESCPGQHLRVCVRERACV